MERQVATPLRNELLVRPDWSHSIPRDPRLKWLDKNENADPEYRNFLLSILKEIDPVAIFTYPELGDLYRKISDYESLKTENIYLTTGSDGAIRSVFDCFVQIGDKVLYTNPTFAMYSVYCKVKGAVDISIDYTAGQNGPLISEGMIVSKIKSERPKLICLPNPDSPSGWLHSMENIKKILDAANEVGAIVLIDEAYYGFCDQTALGFIDQYDCLVIARTFSKAWGLAGLRIGYLVANSDICKFIHKQKPMYEISSFAADFALKLLDYDDEYKKMLVRLREGGLFFKSRLEALGFQVITPPTNFLHVHFRECRERIEKEVRSVALFRGNFGHDSLKKYTRFTCTTKNEFEPIVCIIEEMTN